MRTELFEEGNEGGQRGALSLFSLGRSLREWAHRGGEQRQSCGPLFWGGREGRGS